MWSRSSSCQGLGQGGLGSALAKKLRQGGGTVASSKGWVLLSASSGSCGRGLALPDHLRNTEIFIILLFYYVVVYKTYLIPSFLNIVKKLKVENNCLMLSSAKQHSPVGQHLEERGSKP